MAGGIDLIDCFKSGLHRETVIHLAGIAGLGGIAGKNGDLVIGAAVTHEQFAKDPALVRFFPALAQEWSCLANPRIRAVGTLGGNVMAKNCNYDAVALALAADAELRFAQCAGVVTRKANEPWEPSDLLLEIRIKQASKRRLGDGLGIVVIVLLPLHERLHIHRRNDPRFMPERPQSPAYEMSAEARLEANDAGRNFLEGLNKREPLDLAPESDLPLYIEANEVKDVLADIDADRGKRCCGC